ncbi:MAG: polyphosphate kinase 2 family protein [Anaerolineae bacterium]
MSDEHMVRPGSKVSLKDFSPDYTGKYRRKEQAEEDLSAGCDELVRLQELLYAEHKHSILIVLQAMDTAGKDGTIRHVMSGVNPQGCSVTAFKAPTPEELDHDYLWRVHKAVPPKGMIGIFNRSYYEDVLIVRVHKLVPEKVWRQRYEQINRFEEYLADNGTTILKFYLHISKEEQKKRLQERLDDPRKRWKFALGDLAERKLWPDYMQAYEDMLNRTSTDWAPWYLVPANNKWYRNLVVARTIVQTLRKLDMRYPEPKEDLSGVVIAD